MGAGDIWLSQAMLDGLFVGKHTLFSALHRWKVCLMASMVFLVLILLLDLLLAVVLLLFPVN
jgi:hypothetical protein